MSERKFKDRSFEELFNFISDGIGADSTQPIYNAHDALEELKLRYETNQSK